MESSYFCVFDNFYTNLSYICFISNDLFSYRVNDDFETKFILSDEQKLISKLLVVRFVSLLTMRIIAMISKNIQALTIL